MSNSEAILQAPAPPVAALFVVPNSVYEPMPNVHCYDQQRDALTFPGGMPVVAHPPCRTWGPYAHRVHAPPAEHALALWALYFVRRYGGVLEHPASSQLWKTAHLPPVNQSDPWGLTIRVDQHWWGHRARKRTCLYISGLPLHRLPQIPLVLTSPSHVVGSGYALPSTRHRASLPECAKKERKQTPPAFAHWLITLARATTPSSSIPYFLAGI